MQLQHLDSVHRLHTKKFLGVDLTVAGVTATPNQLVFQPPKGYYYFVTRVWTHNRSVTGTVSDAPAILLDNGTDGNNIVAAVDLPTTDQAFKQQTVASTVLVVSHANPLRLKSTDGADGSTKFLVDVTVELLEFSGN